MSAPHHVYLIPGFFGFANLGELVYFAHVKEVLAAACAAQTPSLKVKVHVVDPPPTASLPRRAVCLLELMRRTCPEGSPAHLIGHSTGGLDARLLLSPGVVLPGGLDPEPMARQVRTVVSVATPHHGTPVAGFFTSLMGRQLLRALSITTIYVMRFGQLPLTALLKLGAMGARLDDLVGLRDTVVDQLFDQLLGEFSPDRQNDLRTFLDEVNEDQALLTQLSQEAMDLFDALVLERPSVRQGCVVTRARTQGLAAVKRIGLKPYNQITHSLFTALHHICGQVDEGLLPHLEGTQERVLTEGYGHLPGPDDTDGIVPTLAQVRGEVVHTAWADHLDVVGHFAEPDCEPPHFDWLSSGSGFRRGHFKALWGDVAAFLSHGG